jgi:hypothetical protein
VYTGIYINGKIDIENLKVHKNENFLASILNFVLFHCKLCIKIRLWGNFVLIGPLWGDLRLFRVVRLSGTKVFFKIDQIFFLFIKSYRTL